MKYAYYPGCSLNSTGLEYNLSARAVARHLGVELWELPDWNCCGASAAHNTDHNLALALPARNLMLADKEGLDMAVPCAACFNRTKRAEKALKASETSRRNLEDLVGMEYKGSSGVFNLLDIMVNHLGTDAIREKVVKPLKGLNVAAYYGCLLVRPPKIVDFDDSEDPQSMDRLVDALGAAPVSWAFKTECCGAGHSTTRPQVAGRMIASILDNARAAGADCLATACPLCFLNLDMRQAEVGRGRGTGYNLPVFYFTELMGLALGYAPRELGINKHFVDANALLERSDVLRHPATRRDEA